METDNAKIASADLCFEEISGVNGRQFTLRLLLEVAGGGCMIFANPLKLPQLLEKLELEKFSELEGCYVKVPKIDMHAPSKLTHIMDDENDWLELDNGRYFGCEWWPVIKEQWICKGEYCE